MNVEGEKIIVEDFALIEKKEVDGLAGKITKKLAHTKLPAALDAASARNDLVLKACTFLRRCAGDCRAYFVLVTFEVAQRRGWLPNFEE
jgi:hypothetical protein